MICVRYGGGVIGGDPTAVEWHVPNVPAGRWYSRLYCFFFPTRAVARVTRRGFECLSPGFEWTERILCDVAARTI